MRLPDHGENDDEFWEDIENEIIMGHGKKELQRGITVQDFENEFLKLWKKFSKRSVTLKEFEDEFHELWSDPNDEKAASEELVRNRGDLKKR